MRLISIVASFALVCFTAGARAEDPGEVWQVVEGQNGSTKGVWNIQRTGNSFRGSAHMVKANGAPLTYGVRGEIKAGRLTLHRIEASDRSDCLYIAQSLPEPRVDGTSICGPVNGIWRVALQPRTDQTGQR